MYLSIQQFSYYYYYIYEIFILFLLRENIKASFFYK